MSDEEMIKQFLDGDDNAIGILIKKYLNPIFSFIYRLTRDAKAAEDLAQETFLKAWKHLKKFDQNKKFKPWLFKIARNAAFDYLRRKKDINFSELSRINEDGENMDFEAVDTAESQLDNLSHKELTVRLEHALSLLPEDDRSLLLLHYVEDITFREIAEIIGAPMNTVKTRHRRAIIKLKKMMINDATGQPDG